MNFLKIFPGIAALLLCVPVYGATTDAQKMQLMKERAQQKVAQMTDNISFMADKGKSVDTRQYFRKKALNLFIGHGNAYEEQGRRKEGVKMQTTSIYSKKPSTKLIKDYFTGLINLKYSKVDIKSTDIVDIKISDLQKIDDDTYVCTAFFVQEFRGFRDTKPVYGDRTSKKVKVYIKVEEDIEGNSEFIVMLGDVTAMETERL